MAQVSKKMGAPQDYERFLKRSAYWQNIWNPETGFLMPRKKDGSWKEPFDPFEGGYQGYIEGCAWSSLWFATHDVIGLANLMGGPDAYSDRLNMTFERTADQNFLKIHSYIDYGNQPSCQIAHLFNYVGKPWLSQYWARQVNEKAYGDVSYAKGLGVGDEDQGQMGGVSALMSMGLFSIRGATDTEPIYEITAPVFDTVTIHLNPDYYEGRQFEITTRNNSARNCYIQSARLNGKPLNQCWFDHRDFAKGAKLDMELGPKPNVRWGSDEAVWPPSESLPDPVAARDRPRVQLD